MFFGGKKNQQHLKSFNKTDKDKERMHITNFGNETRNIITDSATVKNIIKEYNEKFYAKIFESLEKKDQFLESHKLTKQLRGDK